jgi:hypothetical protein
MRTVAIASVHKYNTIIPHFLKHYHDLGVDKIILCVVPDVYDQVLADSRPFARTFLYLINHPQGSQYFDAWKDSNENHALSCFDYDYKMCLDIDEFHEYPAPLSAIIGGMEAKDLSALFGQLVDRFGVGYSTPDVLPDVDIFVQFPLEHSGFTSNCGANDNKVMICRADCGLSYGRHNVKGRGRFHNAKYKVHHFKWTGEGIRNLEKRVEEGSIFDNRDGIRDKREYRDYVKELVCELSKLRDLQRHYGVL